MCVSNRSQHPSGHHVQVYSTYRYTFDRVYGPDASQEEVYNNSARDSVKQVLEVSGRGEAQLLHAECPTARHRQCGVTVVAATPAIAEASNRSQVQIFLSWS